MRKMQWIYMLSAFRIMLVLGFSTHLELDKNSYGPYDINIKRFQSCDKKNLPSTDIMIDGDKLTINVNVTRPCVLAKSRMTVKRVRGDQKTIIFSYGVSDPCTHFAVGPLFKQFMRVKKNCKVEAGSFMLEISIEETTHTFLGTQFFYGEFEFYAILRCQAGDLACMLINSEFRKK